MFDSTEMCSTKGFKEAAIGKRLTGGEIGWCLDHMRHDAAQDSLGFQFACERMSACSEPTARPPQGHGPGSGHTTAGRDKVNNKRRSAHTDEGSGSCKKGFPARLDGWHHKRKRGGVRGHDDPFPGLTRDIDSKAGRHKR